MSIFTLMIREITVSEFLTTDMPLIDVRSPGEYEKGHIPGAVSVPLFSDEERAHIGTVYTNQSAGKAIELGMGYATPKREWYLHKAGEVARGRSIAVHCWRGGMRSQAFAGHLHDHGFPDVIVITGGYKAYRSYLHDYFNTPFDFRIIGGYTGSGKTGIIRELQHQGIQAVDLEAIARHKGSSFGALGCEKQPTSEQFENNLFDQFRPLDVALPIWLEDESHNIGGVNLPLNLYNRMKNSKVWFLDIPREVRARYLVEEYAGYPEKLLEEAILRISKRLGGEQTKNALTFLHEHRFYELTMIILQYYDKSYLGGLKLHDPGNIRTIHPDKIDPVLNSRIIIAHSNQFDNGLTKTI